MTENLIIGLLVTAIPGFVLGYLMLSKQPAIFRMFIAMVLVGLGYLTATGAMEDIGSRVTGKRNDIVVPVEAAPATETPAAEAPAAEAPAAETPKAEAAPAAAPADAPTTDAAAPAAAPATPAPSTQVDPYPGAPKPAQ